MPIKYDRVRTKMASAMQNEFFQRLHDAPYAARGFFETVGSHFQRRNDVHVHYTATNVADMRLEAVWQRKNGTEGRQNFATMYWQSKSQRVSGRCYLTPEDPSSLGFDGATTPKSATETLNSDISLDETGWRHRAQDFIRAMEAARIKLIQAKAAGA